MYTFISHTALTPWQVPYKYGEDSKSPDGIFDDEFETHQKANLRTRIFTSLKKSTIAQKNDHVKAKNEKHQFECSILSLRF